jgi:ABC-2 type transport system ATP-binding protein
MIRFDRLCKSFAGTVALDDITFEVERGEIVGLLGPNGAGKTTCLRILTGFVPPTSGDAQVDGLSVSSRSREVRRRLGYLAEGVPLYPELRVEEQLRHAAGLRELTRAETRRELDRVVESCGLGEVRRRLIGTLSRGFRQRVGLASALLGDPPLLVLDEPTVGLDPNQLREARELIRALAGDHTVLLSTHQLREVEAVCSRAAIIDRGRLVASGGVAELLHGGSAGAVAAVRGDPAEVRAALEAVEGVGKVEILGDEGQPVRVRLHGVIDEAARERVAAAVAEAGLALSELRPAVSSLEEVFHSLTTTGPRRDEGTRAAEAEGAEEGASAKRPGGRGGGIEEEPE